MNEETKYAPPTDENLFAWRCVEDSVSRCIYPVSIENAITALQANGCGEVVLVFAKNGYVHPDYKERLEELMN